MNLLPFEGSNPYWALYAAKFCAAAYGDQVDKDLPAAARQLCGNGVQVGVRDVENGVPAAFRVVGNDGMIVVVSGLSYVSQANNISAGYVTPILTADRRYFNPWFWDSATQLIRNLRLDYWARDRTLYLFGHSAGGGIATAIAAALRPVSPAENVHLVTFGAPRSVAGNGLQFLRDVEITRWMNVGDDVPRLPPRLLDLTDLAFLANAAALPLWYRFLHTEGGLVLHRQGVIDTGDVPAPEHLLGLVTFPSSYLRDGELFGNDHAIAEYIARLLKSIPPAIAAPLGKPVPKFALEPLPEMFQSLTVQIPMPFPGVPVASAERPLANPPIDVAIERREAFIASPIKRC